MSAQDLVTTIFEYELQPEIKERKAVFLYEEKSFTGRAELELPHTYEEARKSLDRIKAEKHGTKNENFSQQQLKKIAENLRISNVGNKPILVRRIRSAIQEHFNLLFD